MEEELTSEYGSLSPIRFADAKAYDSEGNEINLRCEKCNTAKICIIGRYIEAFICPECDYERN